MVGSRGFPIFIVTENRLEQHVVPKFGSPTLRTSRDPHEHPEQHQLEHPICSLMVLSVRLLATDPGSPHIESQTRARSSLFPTCQVRFVRFYQSACPPPPRPPPRLRLFHLPCSTSTSALPTLPTRRQALRQLPSSVRTAGRQPASCPAQCAPLDLNQGPAQLSVHRWTSTGDLPSSVCTAGPQQPDRMPEDMPDGISDRMPEICQIKCHEVCQIECQKICQIECQKICQIECQIECQKVCQIECQKNVR